MPPSFISNPYMYLLGWIYLFAGLVEQLCL